MNGHVARHIKKFSYSYLQENGDMKLHNLSNKTSCRASEMHLGSACHVTDVPLIYRPLNMSWICP